VGRRQHVLVRPLLPLAAACAALVAAALPAGAAGAPPSPYTYTVHVAPQNSGSSASHSAYENAVEPSIGADWTSGLTAFQADLGTYFVAFDDRSRPATATWTERSPVTSAETLDPILYTDNQGTPAAPLGTRTIVSQLAGTTSLSSTTDDAGVTYLPDSSGQTSGVDHQTVGGGPYAAFPPTGTTGLYPSSGPKRAIYYCSQDVATAFCERSDNGGTTFGPPVPIYTVSPGVATGCQGLHGHVRVRPDGVVLVPNKNCGTDVGSLPGSSVNRQAVAENTDNNTTAAGWSIDVVPDSTAGVTDPSTAADASNTMYFGYGDGGGHAKIAVKRAGSGWSSSVDVGALVGVEQTAFPDVIAGSAGRAAFAFLGSTTPTTKGIRGVDRGFAGVWEAYIARTVDSGVTWSVQKVTTDSAFPVQKGCLQLGGSCTHRNLYDFTDITVDRLGRVEYGFADGCVQQADGSTKGCRDGSSTTGDTSSDDTNVGSIARQECGPSLFAEQDAALSAACNAAIEAAPAMPEAPSAPLLITGGLVATGGAVWWRRRTRASR